MSEDKTAGDVIDDIISFAPVFLEDEDRKDAPFRCSIMYNQMGDVARHITHDPELNKKTRPVDEKEEVAFGDAFAQLVILAEIRGVDLKEAVEIGMERIQNREGYKVTRDEMQGFVAYGDGEHTGEVGDDIYVGREVLPDDFEVLDEYDVVLSETGGLTSHAAIYAREKHVPCVVGIKDLTANVESGDLVKVHLNSGKIETRG